MTSDRPVVTFDLDGVLCHPLFGLNPGSLKDEPVTTPGRWNPAWALERWRYFGREPMPGAKEGFAAIAEFAECIVVTGRGEAARGYTEGWLRRHLGVVPRLHMRPHWRERPPQYKDRVLGELNSAAHFEDDPNTALRLAPVRPVYVVAWGRNEGFVAENVQRVASVLEAVEDLRTRIT